MSRTTLLVLVTALAAATAGARELTDVYVVPAVANTPGKRGTDWHTDLTLYNPHSYSLPVVIHFLPSGTSNSGGVATVELDVYPWETLNFWDVLGPDGFDARGTTGALLVYADDSGTSCDGTACDFAVFSRTYTLDPTGGDGEFGQATPGFPAALGLDRSVIAYLPQVMEDDVFRTNLGVVSWTDGWVTVAVEIQDSAGSIIDRSDHLVPPFGAIQWHMDRQVTGGTVAVRIVDGPDSAMVYPYASVANNVSGDAVHVEAQLTPVGLTAQTTEVRALRRPTAHPPARPVPGFDAARLRRQPR